MKIYIKLVFISSLAFISAGINTPGHEEPSPARLLKAEKNIEKAHTEIWKKFIDQYNVLIDFTDVDGSYDRPTREEFLENKPNALAWWTPVENGSMFNGLYLDGICERWMQTKNKSDKEKAARLVKGLLFLASVGDTPGFIARSVATDGKTPPAMGSNDQSSPWFYGLWRYLQTSMPDKKEREKIIAKMTEVANVYISTDWKIPATSYSPSKFRNSFASFNWEGAPRILFISKALYQLTSDGKWNSIYKKAMHEAGGEENKTRLQLCREGMHFEKNKVNRWTGVSGVVDLHALWEMETDPELKRIYEEGLNASAKSAAEGLKLWHQFDSNNQQKFEKNWRLLNQWWKPQRSEQDALDVADTQVKELVKMSPRRVQELHYMREPIWMSWIVTMAADKNITAQHKSEIIDMLGYFDFPQMRYSQFFPVEVVWYRLKL
ncbi:hypothetical protein [Pollutibacter soli]|uniref:hypothetical protein n=1 Tax=Pollutibacter soli TaxID=3034157 RepID=UPI003013B65E